MAADEAFDFAGTLGDNVSKFQILLSVLPSSCKRGRGGEVPSWLKIRAKVFSETERGRGGTEGRERETEKFLVLAATRK